MTLGIIGTELSSTYARLLSTRELVVRKTGDYSLVGTTVNDTTGLATPNYAVDAGVDFFINAAIRWWDERVLRTAFYNDFPITALTYEYSLAAYPFLAIKNVLLDGVPLLAKEVPNMHEYRASLTLGAPALTPAYWSVHTVNGTSITEYLVIAPAPLVSGTLTIEHYVKSDTSPEAFSYNYWVVNHIDKVLYVALMLYNGMDVNVETVSVLAKMVDAATMSVLKPSILNEIALNGSSMKDYYDQ